MLNNSTLYCVFNKRLKKARLKADKFYPVLMWPRLRGYTGRGVSVPEPWCIELMSRQIAAGTLLCLCVKGRSRDMGWCHLVRATAVQDGL